MFVGMYPSFSAATMRREDESIVYIYQITRRYILAIVDTIKLYRTLAMVQRDTYDTYILDTWPLSHAVNPATS